MDTRLETPVRNDDLSGMLIGALRYALGRRTYIVRDTCQWVRAYLPALEAAGNKGVRDVMIKSIESQQRFGDKALGDSCDKEEWEGLLEWLRKRDE